MIVPLPGVTPTGSTQFVRRYLGHAAAARSNTWWPILRKPQQTGMRTRCQCCSFCWWEIQDYLQSRRKESIQVNQAGMPSHELPCKHRTQALVPSDKERKNWWMREKRASGSSYLKEGSCHNADFTNIQNKFLSPHHSRHHWTSISSQITNKMCETPPWWSVQRQIRKTTLAAFQKPFCPWPKEGDRGFYHERNLNVWMSPLLDKCPLSLEAKSHLSLTDKGNSWELFAHPSCTPFPQHPCVCHYIITGTWACGYLCPGLGMSICQGKVSESGRPQHVWVQGMNVQDISPSM